MAKYQIIGNTYICTTIDADTVCQKAEMLIFKTIRNKPEREQIIRDLRHWCKSARPGNYLIRDEFTVIVKAVLKR